MRPVSVRLVPALVVLALLASACTRTPPGGEQTVVFGGSGGGSGDGAGMSTPGEDLAGEFGGGGTADGTLGGTSGGTPSGGGASGIGSGGGALGGSGSGGGGGTGGGSAAAGGGVGGPAEGAAQPAGMHPGVVDRTVKLVFHVKEEACGDDPSRAQEGIATGKGKLVVAEYVKWFNEKVLAPRNWKLSYEFVDDGGAYCPEKAQAAGLRIAKEIKPFAALGDIIQPDRGPVLADVVTRAGILHIGTNWDSYDELRARRTLAWPVFAVAERGFENLIGWMERRVVGTQVVNATTGVPEGRVYGLLAIDSPEGRRLAGIAQERLRAIGAEPVAVYLVSGDVGVVGQQASNTVLKMRQDGVNTLVFGLSYNGVRSTLILSEAMNSQNYLPEILVGTYGVAFLDQLHNKRVWARARGTSAAGIIALRVAVAAREDGSLGVPERYEEIAENNEGYILVWQQELGHNDLPTDGSDPSGYSVWAQLAKLSVGIAHAGDVLNAETFAKGLDSAVRGGPNRCDVARYMGRDYRYNPGFDWDTAGDGGVQSFATIYWVNEQTPFGTNGYYESYDDYRYFNDAAELAGEPAHDTGEEGVGVPKQEQIGIRPWTPCSQFPAFPTD